MPQQVLGWNHSLDAFCMFSVDMHEWPPGIRPTIQNSNSPILHGTSKKKKMLTFSEVREEENEKYFNSLTGSSTNTFSHNRPSEDVYDLHAAPKWRWVWRRLSCLVSSESDRDADGRMEWTMWTEQDEKKKYLVRFCVSPLWGRGISGEVAETKMMNGNKNKSET